MPLIEDHAVDRLRDAIAVLIGTSATLAERSAVTDSLYEWFAQIVDLDPKRDAGDTLLPSGVALSPALAGSCLKDPIRVSVFLRGIEAAIREAQRRFPGETIEILYAGTGPFAPLTIPLVTRFSPGEVRFTLLDIHARSIEAVKLLVDSFGLEAYVRDCVTADATTYEHGGHLHIVMGETTQRALAKEPHLAIVRNLVPQLAPNGMLIPERITVDLMFTHPAEPDTTRVHVARLIDLTADSARSPLPEVVVEVCDVPGIAQLAFAYVTRLHVFGPHVLEPYDTGVTHPEILWRLKPVAGQRIAFRYAMGPRPGLQWSVEPLPAVAYIRRLLSDRLTNNDETILVRRIRYSVGRAKAAGLRDPAAIRLYAVMMFALEPEFDERFRVREYLEKAHGSLDERLLRMYEWSYPNCWYRAEPWFAEARWNALVTEEEEPNLPWPDSDVLPPQLQSGYGFQLDVPIVHTPPDVVDVMLDLAALEPSDFLIDLGCGDGRIVIAAAKKFGVRGRGIDLDPEQLARARAAAKAEGVENLVAFQRQDLLDTDLAGATVVTLFLLRGVNLLLREKLRHDLPRGARVISRAFDMADWLPESEIETPEGRILRWTVV